MNSTKFEGAYNDKDKYLHLTLYQIYSAEEAHGMWQLIMKEMEGKKAARYL